MYSAFIPPVVYTFRGVETVFSPHSSGIYDSRKWLFHRYSNNRNNLFPLVKQSVSLKETNCFIEEYCRET
jgi:hypothetical protein